jgi:CubicO group peptidase (beta-lactamase class C family)
MRKLLTSIFLFVLNFTVYGIQDNWPDYIDSEERELIDFLFSDYNGDQPGASVMVIKDQQIAWKHSYGLANINEDLSATEYTNYRIASVTKQFTAFAVLMLIHEGKLDYETTLNQIFPEFPDYGSTINIHHLLCHRSGLVHYGQFIKEGREEQILDPEILKGLLSTDSTKFEPGSKYSYSNTGYAVLAMVVEKVSGMSFPDFMEKKIFDPLGMKDAMVYEKDQHIKNRAYGYIVTDSSITLKDQNLSSAVMGDGGIYCSVEDYFKWDQALYTDKLIPYKMYKEAFYAQEAQGRTSEAGYGYGWKIAYRDSLKILYHGGSSVGFGSFVYRIPEENLSVVIFTNRSRTGYGISDGAKALASIFSNYKLKMPIEVVMRREIEQNGVEAALKLYQEQKNSTDYHSSKEALFYLGVGYLNGDKYAIATSLFEQLIEEYPAYYGGYYGLGYTYKSEGRTDEAIANFKKVTELDSKDIKRIIEVSQQEIEKLSN